MRRLLRKLERQLYVLLGAGNFTMSVILTQVARTHLDLSDYWAYRAQARDKDPPKENSP